MADSADIQHTFQFDIHIIGKYFKKVLKVLQSVNLTSLHTMQRAVHKQYAEQPYIHK